MLRTLPSSSRGQPEIHPDDGGDGPRKVTTKTQVISGKAGVGNLPFLGTDDYNVKNMRNP